MYTKNLVTQAFEYPDFAGVTAGGTAQEIFKDFFSGKKLFCFHSAE